MSTSLTLPVYSFDGAEVSNINTVELPESIFDAPTNVALLHQVVTAQLAAARQGTSAVKNRTNISGGGKKPYRQKGTGRARQGSIRAPQFTGGAVAHGPVPRSYAQRTPKKMIAAALRGALSDRVRNERLLVVDELVAGQVPSTKKARTFIEKLTPHRKVLLVLNREDSTSVRSAANLPNVHILTVDQLNTYDVLGSDIVIFALPALHTFIESYAAKTASAQQKVGA